MTKRKVGVASRVKEMGGLRFGRLLVIERDCSRNGVVYWLCQCDCGNRSIAKGTSLRFGATKSCGCGSIEQAARNCRAAREAAKIPYQFSRKMKDARSNMLRRCYDPANKRWDNYGGRGIAVCAEWRNDPGTFYKFMNDNGWRPGLSIDRIDVNGHYEPSNCRFVDIFVQQNNTTRNVFLTWGGERKTVADWAKTFGVANKALQHRVDRKWPVERIFTQPFRKRANGKYVF